MNFISRLANRQRIRRAIDIIRNGHVIRFDFHPMRKGALRMAQGTNAVEITWIRRHYLDRAFVNLKPVHLQQDALHDQLLTAVLLKADQIIEENQRKFLRHMPSIKSSSDKRMITPMAERLAKAIFDAKTIKDDRNSMGFGPIRVGLSHMTAELHTLEDQQLPAISMNGLPIFSKEADILHVTHAFTTRLRPMIPAPLEQPEPYQYEYAA